MLSEIKMNQRVFRWTIHDHDLWRRFPMTLRDFYYLHTWTYYAYHLLVYIHNPLAYELMFEKLISTQTNRYLQSTQRTNIYPQYSFLLIFKFFLQILKFNQRLIEYLVPSNWSNITWYFKDHFSRKWKNFNLIWYTKYLGGLCS